MTPTAVQQWLADMQSAGLAASERECADLLGVTVETKRKWKREGADQRTALACAALLKGLPPYLGDEA